MARAIAKAAQAAKTVGERAEIQAAAISKANELKLEASKCSRAIHSMGGEEVLWDRLASGATVMAVSAELGVSLSALDRWVQRGGDERRERYARARARGGQSLAEQTIAIADSADIESVQLAKLRIDQRWKLAGKLDPETYGERNGPVVNIDLGSLALEALRRRDV